MSDLRYAVNRYAVNFQVDIDYDEFGSDNVKIMEAHGCCGRRVAEPGDIRDALAWAREQALRTSRPVLVEIMIEREANAAMGPALDAITEFEPAP